MARQKHGWIGLSHSDIAKLTGIPRSTVADISVRDTWAGLAIDVIDKFSRACGVNLLAPAKRLDQWKRGKLVYLRRADKNQSKFYKRLTAKLTMAS